MLEDKLKLQSNDVVLYQGEMVYVQQAYNYMLKVRHEDGFIENVYYCTIDLI